MTPLREFLRDYKRIDAPISGGWGTAQSDAIIIDANDVSVTKGIPFDGAGIERALVKELVHFDLISSRKPEDQLGCIEWQFLEQELLHDGERVIERLRYQVSGYHYQTLTRLLGRMQDPNDLPNESEQAALLAEMEAAKWSGARNFWFDITSYYGK